MTSSNHSWLGAMVPRCALQYNPDFLLSVNSKPSANSANWPSSQSLHKKESSGNTLKTLGNDDRLCKNFDCSIIYITEKHAFSVQLDEVLQTEHTDRSSIWINK